MRHDPTNNVSRSLLQPKIFFSETMHVHRWLFDSVFLKRIITKPTQDIFIDPLSGHKVVSKYFCKRSGGRFVPGWK